MKHTHSICLIAAVVMTAGAHGGAVEDRTAVERVYHGHRSGEARRFDEVATSADIQHLVTRDARKERVLLEHYGVSVTDALVDEEVTRINHSTRAPDVLAEIRAALGNDEKRFADAVARPIVVDRLLTAHFASDAAVHGPLAEKVKAQREALLAASAECIVLSAELRWGIRNALRRWCTEQGVPLHDMRDQGAFIRERRS